MILQILDSITFSILRSQFDLILNLFLHLFFKAQVAMPFKQYNIWPFSSLTCES